jgi:hypothetical protein
MIFLKLQDVILARKLVSLYCSIANTTEMGIYWYRVPQEYQENM